MKLQKERFKVIPAVFLILIKDNRIFMMKRQNTGYEDGNWDLMSGHIEPNELLTQAVVREAKEEIGINIDVKNLKLMHVLNRISLDWERVDFFFQANIWKGEPKIMEDKSSEIKWFELNNLPENVIKPVRQAIDNILKNQPYSEYKF